MTESSRLAAAALAAALPAHGQSPRGGKPVTLRDAMLAVSEFVTKDEEMPEYTFAFAEDGALASVCDMPVAPWVWRAVKAKRRLGRK